MPKAGTYTDLSPTHSGLNSYRTEQSWNWKIGYKITNWRGTVGCRKNEQPHMPQSNTFSPCSIRKMPIKSLHWLGILPGEKIQSQGSKWQQRENSEPQLHWQGVYQILLLVSHKLEKPYLSHWAGNLTFHPVPCLTILCIPPLGELRPGLNAPLQDKAEQS